MADLVLDVDELQPTPLGKRLSELEEHDVMSHRHSGMESPAGPTGGAGFTWAAPGAGAACGLSYVHTSVHGTSAFGWIVGGIELRARRPGPARPDRECVSV